MVNLRSLLIFALWLGSVAGAFFLGGGWKPVPAMASRQVPSGSSQGEAGAARPSREEAPDLPLLLAGLRSQLASFNGVEPDNLVLLLRATAALEKLDEAHLLPLLDEMERTVSSVGEKNRLYRLLLGRWAEMNPTAALAYAQEHLRPPALHGNWVRSRIIAELARQNPAAGWQWFESRAKDAALEPGGYIDVAGFFSGIAENDLETALQRLDGMKPGERSAANEGIASIAMDETSRRRLLERAASLRSGSYFRESILRSWTTDDPEGAIRWVRTLPEPQRPFRFQRMADQLKPVDPAIAADLRVEGVQSVKDRANVYDSIVSNWADEDPAATGEWLLKQPQGPELDLARRTYALALVGKDPDAAMDWAKNVQRAEARVEAVQRIYERWRAKDATAAEMALEHSGLSEEQIREVKAAR